jgi:hypothetical protein
LTGVARRLEGGMPRCPDRGNMNGRQHEVPAFVEMVGVLVDVVSRPLVAAVNVKVIEP